MPVGTSGFQVERRGRPKAPHTRSDHLRLAEQVESPEAVMKGRTQGLKSLGAGPNDEDSGPKGCDKSTQTKEDQLTDVMEEIDIEWNWEHPKSVLNPSGKLRRAENFLISRAHVHKFVEELMQEVINKLDDRVINIAEQTEFNVLDSCDVDHN